MPKKKKVVFLLVHGLGAYAERWHYLIDFFKKYKVHCIAPDFPAQGPLSEWHKIIDTELSKLRLGTEEVYLIGESLGGLISYNKMLTYNKKTCISGCILLSPAFKSVLRFSLWKYLSIVIGIVFPWIRTKAPFSAAMCTRDGGYQQKMQHNKHETRNFSSKLYLDIVFQQICAIFKQNRTNIPCLFLLAGNDTMVSTKAAQEIYKRLGISVPKKCIVYPGAAHALSIDTCRNKVFTDILHWIRGLQ